MNKQKPNYGLDAPKIIKSFAFIGIGLLIGAILANILLPHHWLSYLVMASLYLSSIFTFYPAITIFLGSKIFKFRERNWLFEKTSLSGNENVLDVGCGHGLLLIEAAKKLTTGKVYGIDLWVKEDQSSNSSKETLRNVEIEGVTEKIEIVTGDMRNLPFANEFFDVVVSSWAIHNLRQKVDRDKTLAEMARVLKPGRKMAILDIEYAQNYADFLKKHAFENVQILGPRYTFGNKTYLVLATKKMETVQ